MAAEREERVRWLAAAALLFVPPTLLAVIGLRWQLPYPYAWSVLATLGELWWFRTTRWI
jgi:hypothetical protein